ncbi:helix-turn-helix transcriptional regulator [bacterium]|nr:helix-turn-helix transcriptional regulator [bacterium]
MQDEIFRSNSKRLMTALGAVIKEKRILQNKTMYAISAEASMSKSTWREVELGICNDVKLTTLWKIAEGLGMPLSDLIKETAVRLGEDFSLTDLEQ